MKKLLLADVLTATKGRLLSGQTQEIEFKGVGTDTRVDLADQLFIALKGDQFDAHEFVLKAAEQNSAAILVHQQNQQVQELIQQKKCVILVPDTLQALQDLAQFQRRKSPAKIIGITGSNGKTTSKEFSAAVIGAKRKVHIPKGSFNNHWGVPLTLLAEPEGTEVSVIEMGMNHFNEIKRLVEIAEPDIVVCSMVGRAHIEYFGSIDQIAIAKEEIYRYASPQAQRIFNLDNPWTHNMYQKAKTQFPRDQITTFSNQDSQADVYLKISKLEMGKLNIHGHIHGTEGAAEVPVFGAQNLVNLMVAASCALKVGMSAEEIWQALPNCRTNWGRNQLVKLKSGAELLFDGYNANPDSMMALLENVKLFTNPGKKIGVFAQMKELGELSEKSHFELGQAVGQTGFDCVWFYGDDFAAFEGGIKKSGYSKKLVVSRSYEDSLASEVASVLKLGDALVVKGSRGLKLERFVMACDPVNFTLNKE